MVEYQQCFSFYEPKESEPDFSLEMIESKNAYSREGLIEVLAECVYKRIKNNKE